MERMERVLEELERGWNLNILWKYVGMGRTSCGLSERHSYHWCEFCRQVKSGRAGLRLCSINDDLLLPRRAEKERGPFISTCHAGVSELVIPLFEGERCTEVFLAGIFLCKPGEIPGVKRIEEEKLSQIQKLLTDLSVIFRERRDCILREREFRKEISDIRIRHAVEFIEKRFAEKIRIQDLASKVCLSESRFLHLFRQETGCSVFGFLTGIRLKTARQLLEVSGASIQNVMEQCGFHDQSRFGKLFKEFTGYSPLAYHWKFRRKRDV